MGKTVDSKAIKHSVLKAVAPLIHEAEEIDKINIDKITNSLNISKSTLYKVFSSKEEIFKTFVNNLLDYFEENSWQGRPESLEDFQKFYNYSFYQEVALAIYLPEHFRDFLKRQYPNLMNRINGFLLEREKQQNHFIQSGIELKIIKDSFDPRISNYRDFLLLSSIISGNKLVDLDLTAKQFLTKLYYMNQGEMFIHPYTFSSLNKEIIDPLLSKLRDL